jgi:hypothetical protein
MAASLDVERMGNREVVRLFLGLSPNDRGFEFRPEYRVYAIDAAGHPYFVEGRFEEYTLPILRNDRYDVAFAADLRLGNGWVLGAQIYANPTYEDAFLGSGEIDLGYLP